MTLGERLKQLRLSKRWTQEYVADCLFLVRSTYSYYEQGKAMPNILTLEKLSDFFGVSLDYLIKGTEPETITKYIVKELPKVCEELNPVFVYGKDETRFDLSDHEMRLLIAFRLIKSFYKRRQILEYVEREALCETNKYRSDNP